MAHWEPQSRTAAASIFVSRHSSIRVEPQSYRNFLQADEFT
jgi:hypothetical protein